MIEYEKSPEIKRALRQSRIWMAVFAAASPLGAWLEYHLLTRLSTYDLAEAIATAVAVFGVFIVILWPFHMFANAIERYDRLRNLDIMKAPGGAGFLKRRERRIRAGAALVTAVLAFIASFTAWYFTGSWDIVVRVIMCAALGALGVELLAVARRVCMDGATR